MEKEKILVSACLLGDRCRYDGTGFLIEKMGDVAKLFDIIPLCPEVSGGLPTPRAPAERTGDKVINKAGEDVTEGFAKGAIIAVALCKELGIKTAILKARSPSCGTGKIYDGKFQGGLIDGDGITSQALQEAGVRVLTEDDIDLLLG